MAVHNFNNDLTWSLEQEDFLNEFYKGYFQNMVEQELVTDIDIQKSGIDRFITLANGKIVSIDEKIRRRAYNESPDVLIEYVSNNTTGAKGWIEKDSAVDYIAYIWLNDRKGVLLPFFLLQRAWETNKEEWLATYPVFKGQNKNYHSLNVAVPLTVLVKAINKAMCISI